MASTARAKVNHGDDKRPPLGHARPVEPEDLQPNVDQLWQWVHQLEAREREVERREHAVRNRELAADKRDLMADEREQLADERDRLADEQTLWGKKPKPPYDVRLDDVSLLEWQRRTLETLKRSRLRLAETAVALNNSDRLIARHKAQQPATGNQPEPGE